MRTHLEQYSDMDSIVFVVCANKVKIKHSIELSIIYYWVIYLCNRQIWGIAKLMKQRENYGPNPRAFHTLRLRLKMAPMCRRCLNCWSTKWQRCLQKEWSQGEPPLTCHTHLSRQHWFPKCEAVVRTATRCLASPKPARSKEKLSRSIIIIHKLFCIFSFREDINKSYKHLAVLLHPDKNLAPGSDEAFKSIAKAREKLLGIR